MLALLASVVVLLVIVPALLLGITKAFVVYISTPPRKHRRLPASSKEPTPK